MLADPNYNPRPIETAIVTKHLGDRELKALRIDFLRAQKGTGNGVGAPGGLQLKV
jgi:hypothetical protein